ncbi:MAG TPA: hypothetical protein PKH07_07945 [bacterium]|nr:hypothetical protein [bacterium]
MQTVMIVSSRQQRYFCGFLLSAFALLLLGCATTRETAPRSMAPMQSTEPVRVAILPPEIDASLLPENIRPESSWFVRLFWLGRGAVITSSELQKEIRLVLISYLTMGKKYELVFPVETVEEAVDRHADWVLSCKVHDARTVLLGPNRRYFYVMLTPLPTQYFIRCLTLEARLDWDIDVVSLCSQETVFKKHHRANYLKTVRYAFPKYFEPKMWRYLRYEALPAHIMDTFELPQPTPTAAAD